ncbi:Ribosomal protein L10;Ribosomal protein L7/L12 [Candidatus Karelsulcia muelleri DMIN]|uniref:Large ribosomal subunit protein bL12 n=1 Tax=Karelsulcia muelleri (strain DMIN) TaxID=641892 RepID=D5D8J0_KARMD|nr:Ribosomal protein L10;Ribosomal protein L7/L12 [Candidatus Karelsulcia muelleri DMIN]
MKKNQLISSYINIINNNNCIYLVDLSELTDEKVYDFRKKCYEKDIKLKFIKNTLFKKAIQNSNYKELTTVIKGPTALMVASNTAIANPAIIINNFKKLYSLNKEYLKAAYIENKLYLGDRSLNDLINLKSKNDLLIDIFFLIKKNIINIIKNLKTMKEIKEIKTPATATATAKIANLAKELVNLTVTEVNELTIILKKDYGLESSYDNSVKKITETDSINQEQKKENRKYNVILKSSGPSKLAVVKLIKEITGRGLKDSKELVDSVPTTIKESLNKEEAELFKKKFEEIGAEIEIELF